MPAMTPEMYTSESQKWMTPPPLVSALLALHGEEQFCLDPCCSERNIPARIHFQFPKWDGLKESWLVNDDPLILLNPPYETLKEWLQKACAEAKKGCRIWAVVPARTETRYQQDYGIAAADFTVFLKGRVNFVPDSETRERLIQKWTGKNLHRYPLLTPETVRPFAEKAIDGGNATFPTILLYWGHDAQRVMERWVSNPPRPGTIMRPVRESERAT